MAEKRKRGRPPKEDTKKVIVNGEEIYESVAKNRSKEYRDEFEEQYHRIGIRIKKDLADEVKAYVKEYNDTHEDRMTVNSLVTELLEREIRK